MASRSTERQSEESLAGRHPTKGRLDGVVVAFDLDNTLLDPTGEAYEKTVGEFVSLVDIGLDSVEVFDAYEHLRARSKVFERIGLRNPNHDRGNADILAVLCLTHARNPETCRELGIDPALGRNVQSVFDELHQLESPTRSPDPRVRLEAEIKLRRHLHADSSVVEFIEKVKRIAEHVMMDQWARQYRRIERDHTPFVGGHLLDDIEALGAIPIVITEGQCDVQREKLSMAGILKRLHSRVLISESGGEVPGRSEFLEHINTILDAAARGECKVPEDDTFRAEWLAYVVLDLWQTKSPAFYARCLHAIHSEPRQPESNLLKCTIVPNSRWSANPLHFVMIGDRYDRDIAPLIDLLGPGVGQKYRLKCGKYAKLDDETAMNPARRPDRTLNSWDELSKFLTTGLGASDIPAIDFAPSVAPADTVSWDVIRPALESPFETASVVAEMILADRA